MLYKDFSNERCIIIIEINNVNINITNINNNNNKYNNINSKIYIIIDNNINNNNNTYYNSIGKPEHLLSICNGKFFYSEILIYNQWYNKLYVDDVIDIRYIYLFV